MFKKIKDKLVYYLFLQMEALQKRQENQKTKELISQFKGVGKGFIMGKDYSVKNAKYIEFGDNFYAGERFRIEAWDNYFSQEFNPHIKIGDNVVFNTDIHIGCINKIEIGDNCLFASRIYITDHHHGDTSDGMNKIIAKERPLISKGVVKIENNVWVGEGVAIMPNVTIGENSIIATNAVVTKDVPKNSVVAGIPARVIKTLN